MQWEKFSYRMLATRVAEAEERMEDLNPRGLNQFNSELRGQRSSSLNHDIRIYFKLASTN
jgi:hypothetical protein